MKTRVHRVECAGGPAGRCGAFTLVEMVAALVIIAVLAALLLPRLIKRIDLATHAQETANLVVIRDALEHSVLRSKSIPGHTNWHEAVADWSAIPVPQVATNARRYQRLYFVQTTPTPALIYTQTTNGTSRPEKLRAMVVSIVAGDQFNSTNCPAPNGGVLSDAAFNALWNTPDGARPTAGNWASWKGTGDDFLIQRMDYAPLLHHLVLVNRDTNSTWFTIDGSPTIQLARNPTNNTGWDAYYVDGTIIGLCDTGGNLMAQHVLSRDISFVFEAGLWRAQIVGAYTGVTEADEFADEAAAFMSSEWSGARGADQQGVMTAMYSFMYIYTLWGNQNPHFPLHGATPGQVPEYLMLRDIADDNARLDEFSWGLVK